MHQKIYLDDIYCSPEADACAAACVVSPALVFELEVEACDWAETHAAACVVSLALVFEVEACGWVEAHTWAEAHGWVEACSEAEACSRAEARGGAEARSEVEARGEAEAHGVVEVSKVGSFKTWVAIVSDCMSSSCVGDMVLSLVDVTSQIASLAPIKDKGSLGSRTMRLLSPLPPSPAISKSMV